MNCEAVLEKLSLLAEDDLPAEEALAVRAHLAECEACAAAYRDIIRLTERLRAVPLPALPPGLRERIDVALEAAEEGQSSRPPRTSPWEVVAPYLAAAAVIAVAFALASFLRQPRRATMRVAKSSAPMLDNAEVAVAPEAPTSSEASGGAKQPATKPQRSRADEEEAVREAIEKIAELHKKREIESRERESMTTGPSLPAEGSPSGIVEITPPEETVSSGPRAKPPGAFAAESTADNQDRSRMPARPTVIQLQFLPPENPTVGASANAVVEVTSRETIAEVVVTASGDESLKIDRPEGVLYRGPLRAGEAVRVPLPMVASTSGSHQIDIHVESDAPGGSTQLKVFVPGFKSRPAPRTEPSPGEKPVSLVFKNVPIRQALMDIARQGGLRLEMAEGLGKERITRDVRGVPAKAALRAVAEAGGYTVTEHSGVFTITRSTDSSHE